MVAIDENGKIALVNSLVEQMFLYERKELLGQPLEILIPHDFCDSYLKFSPTRLPHDIRSCQPWGSIFRGNVKTAGSFLWKLL